MEPEEATAKAHPSQRGQVIFCRTCHMPVRIWKRGQKFCSGARGNRCRQRAWYWDFKGSTGFRYAAAAEWRTAKVEDFPDSLELGLEEDALLG